MAAEECVEMCVFVLMYSQQSEDQFEQSSHTV